jgi:hypothetical protein
MIALFVYENHFHGNIDRQTEHRTLYNKSLLDQRCTDQGFVQQQTLILKDHR